MESTQEGRHAAPDGPLGGGAVAHFEVRVVEREEDGAFVEQARRPLLDEGRRFFGESQRVFVAVALGLGEGPHAQRHRDDVAVRRGPVGFGAQLEERFGAHRRFGFGRTERLAPPVKEHPQRRAIGGNPHARCGRVGAFARLGKLEIERWVGAKSRRPTEEVHAPVPNGAGAADGVRDSETGLDGLSSLAPCADGGEREPQVD